jgi:glycosyltransferase involved in cell wall biosynthesis
MSKIKIIFPTAYFCSWNGGTKLIKMCIESILYFDKKRSFKYIILVPDKNIISVVKRIYFIIKNFINGLFKFKITYIEWPYYSGAKEIRKSFSNKKNVEIVGVDFRDEEKYANNYDVNFLSMHLSSKGKKIGYMFDFQHKYLKKFFSKKQQKDRNILFHEIVKNNRLVIVNSHQTKNDIFKFIRKKTNIYVLPFLPFLDFNLNDIKKKIIKEEYFIICNQFWSHKNFETAIHAFKYLKDLDVKLVITGQLSNKNLNYYNLIKKLINENELQKKILLLNNLKKTDQLSLINHSLGLVQPTLFEGGPGGFSVYEAISLNKLVIVSDIKVNKEIKYKKIIYFKSKSYVDLSIKLRQAYSRKFNSITKKKLIKHSNSNKILFGKFLYNLILNNYHKI